MYSLYLDINKLVTIGETSYSNPTSHPKKKIYSKGDTFIFQTQVILSKMPYP